MIRKLESKSFLLVLSGSFAVDFRDHLRSGIICGPFWGSSAVSGSFAVLYSLFYKKMYGGFCQAAKKSGSNNEVTV